MFHRFSCSEPGDHPVNEDAFLVQPHARDPHTLLVAVADGEGTQQTASRAARLACDQLVEQANRYTTEQLALFETWNTIFRAVDDALYRDAAAGFVSLAGFCVTESIVVGASCGDAAVVLFNPGRSPDVLTARQKPEPLVGSGFAVCADFASPLVASWKLMAMTDGVWKHAGWHGVFADGKRSAKGVADALVNRVRRKDGRGLPDDFTLVVVQNWL